MAPPPPLFDAPTQSSPSRCSTHLWRRSCLLPSFYPIILLKNMAVEKKRKAHSKFFIEKNLNLSTTIILVPFPLLPSFSVAWPFKPSDIHYVSLRLLACFQRNNAVCLNPFDTPTATPSFPPSVRLPERTAATYCLVLASIKLWWNKKKRSKHTHTHLPFILGSLTTSTSSSSSFSFLCFTTAAPAEPFHLSSRSQSRLCLPLFLAFLARKRCCYVK